MKSAYYEQRIWRIMSVNNVNPPPEDDIDAQYEACDGKIHVLREVSHPRLDHADHMACRTAPPPEFLEHGESWSSIDMDTVDFLVKLLPSFAQSDNCHWVPSTRQRVRFVPNSCVSRKVILYEHQDPE